MIFCLKSFVAIFVSAVVCFFTAHNALADISSTAAVITSVVKQKPDAPQVRRTSVQQLGPLATSGKISDTAKRRPSTAQGSAFDATPLAPAGLRTRLTARSAIIMDAGTGQIIYAHEPDRAGQPASTIKVLTGLVAMNALRDSSLIKVSHRAAKMPRSKIYLHQGRQYRADDLINAVLIASANDASVALAEWVAGSEKTFAKLMNRKARELGARSTVCKSASGLTVRGQRSTVRDLAVVFTRAMEDAEFARRISTVRVNTSYGRRLNNHNKALWAIEGAKGGKTGYTHAARQTYVGMFERRGGAITVAIMGSETMWDDVATLVEYGFKRRSQLIAEGKLASKPAMIASLKPLADEQGSAAQGRVSARRILSQVSKQSKM